MRFLPVETADDVARFALKRIRFWLDEKPSPAFALPTGATPLPLYAMLIAACRDDGLDLQRARLFALDEFWGQDMPATSTFAHFLQTRLLEPAGIPIGQLTALPTHGDATTAARNHEAAIARTGGLDLTLLGIGGNGHIAFNEPGTSFDSPTGLRTLDDRTQAANAYLFPGNTPVPSQGLTMGIGTVLSSREILLMATGPAKTGIIARLNSNEISTELPASALWQHERVTVVCDGDAAKGLG